jgi:hypothetical protein
MRQDYVDQIRKIMNSLSVVNETPQYDDSELPLGVVAKISPEELNLYFDHYGTIANVVEIYKEKNGNDFVAGGLLDNGVLINIVNLMTQNKVYPVNPTQLKKDYIQVNHVMIAEEFAKQGLVTAVYEYIARRIDVVSDNIQFRGAKRLWKSLAKTSSVYIQVFDGKINDYIRDNKNNVIVYNLSNIDENRIWGDTENQKVLLIASSEIKK